MKHSTGKPTRAQQDRFRRIQEVGCIACRTRGLHRECEIHHLVSGNRRRGHDATIGLCPYHHRGVPEDWGRYGFGHGLAEVRGPSLADGSKAFHAAFGSDDELLKLQNELIGMRAAA